MSTNTTNDFDVPRNNLSLHARRYHQQETPSEKLDRWMDQCYANLPDFLRGFLPSLVWLPKYNRVWLLGDIISGFTVGVMLVPQSVAYARLAQLPVQHGLYSSFIANIIYAFVGGSREIAVGPNAVLSLMVASIVQSIRQDNDSYTGPQIAAALSILLAFVSITLGVLRLGIILDLIPSPVILGFTTGAALTIMLSQIGSMFGIPGITTTKHTWEIIGDVFSNIVNIKWINLVFGLTSLLFLILFPILIGYISKKFPRAQTIGVATNAIVVIIFTLISFIILLIDKKADLSIVGEVPSGFGKVGFPDVDSTLWSKMISSAPGLFLVAILEHTAVCKNFSAKVGYQVSTSQEFFAVGISNILVSIFSGFPVSGSLSRGAVLSRSGVRTPLVGLFIGIILVAALCFLTPAFYYIPTATLGAVIMRAGLSLLPSISVMRELWATRITDFFIFSIAGIITFFFGVQYGIGAAVGIAFTDLIYRIARPKFYVLGEVEDREGIFVDKVHPAYTTHDPEPGVIIFRIQESILFPNIGYLSQQLMDHVIEFSKSLAPPPLSKDRLWSSDLQDRARKLRSARALRNGTPPPNDEFIPPLRAVILDFGAVNAIDASGIQGLRELRHQLYLYAGAHPTQADYFNNDIEMSWDPKFLPHFQLHFVSIHTRVLRALVLSGLPCPLSLTSPSHKKSMLSKKVSGFTPKKDCSAVVNTSEDIVQFQLTNNNNHSLPWSPEPMADLAMSFIDGPNLDLEPIILDSSPYIHLTVYGAVKRIRATLP